MPTNYKILYVLILFLFMLGISCQQEESEIITPDNEEVIEVNSNLGSLLLQTSSNDGFQDDLLDNASCIEIKLPVSVTVNGELIIINTLNDISLVEENIASLDNDNDIIEISFPITIILSDYTEVVVTNEEELLQYVISNFCKFKLPSSNYL